MTGERAARYARIRELGGILDLSDRTKFHLRGADRVRFLNGQASNDVRKCTPGGAALYACILTAKGKMSADVYISASPEFLRIDAEPELRESLGARLERYVISDDVVIEDATDQEGLLHILSAPEPSSLTWPATVQAFRSERLGSPGTDLAGDRSVIEALRDKLAQDLPLVDGETSEVLRIERGVPRWGRELAENTIPVEAGLERRAVDYTKGCYIGQEIISRLRSIGHVNRQLRGVIAPAETTLKAGLQLWESAGTSAVGSITSAAYSFALEKWIGLGYVKRSVASVSLQAIDPDSAAGSTPHLVTLTSVPFI